MRLLSVMKASTKRRYQRIREAFNARLGTMPVMRLYAQIGEDFDLSEERIRKILARKKPP